jgi:hypothetical protein
MENLKLIEKELFSCESELRRLDDRQTRFASKQWLGAVYADIESKNVTFSNVIDFFKNLGVLVDRIESVDPAGVVAIREYVNRLRVTEDSENNTVILEYQNKIDESVVLSYRADSITRWVLETIGSTIYAKGKTTFGFSTVSGLSDLLSRIFPTMSWINVDKNYVRLDSQKFAQTVLAFYDW